MTTATPLARYSAINGALASGFVTAELHHSVGHDLASVHASVFNHFNRERHLYSRQNFKANRAAALTEWRQLCAA